MAGFERFEVELPPDLARFLHDQTGRGALLSNGDVVRTALRILQDHHEQSAWREQVVDMEAAHDEVRRKIAEGVASLRAGDTVDGDAFMAALDDELAKRGRSPGL